ncbi:MAG TPA: hypothetical protein VD713_00340, partial [Sphingomonadales bacterium]|nr:hypothetical protein [Sphingomonadales bacterium]
MKTLRHIGLGLAFGVISAALNPAHAIRYEFTPQALEAITDNEMRRTQLCVVSDIRKAKLEAERQKLIADQEEARGLGRLDLASTLDTDLAKIETELAAVERDFFRCDGAFLLGPQAAQLCKRLGWKKGVLCPSLAQARTKGKNIPLIVDSMEKLVTGQGQQAWQVTVNPVALGPGGRFAGAAVRRGNLQVLFRVGAEAFPIGGGNDAVPRDIEKQLHNVNHSHGIALGDDTAIYVPFLSAEMVGANGFAGETFQTLVGIRGEEGYVPLGPAVPVSIETKSTSHGVPLDAKAWAELPMFQVIGIVGSKRVGDKDEFLYFIGAETLGLQPL